PVAQHAHAVPDRERDVLHLLVLEPELRRHRWYRLGRLVLHQSAEVQHPAAPPGATDRWEPTDGHHHRDGDGDGHGHPDAHHADRWWRVHGDVRDRELLPGRLPG